ncbi:hypothetical protein D3C85_882460 [compost metagenome]
MILGGESLPKRCIQEFCDRNITGRQVMDLQKLDLPPRLHGIPKNGTQNGFSVADQLGLRCTELLLILCRKPISAQDLWQSKLRVLAEE